MLIADDDDPCLITGELLHCTATDVGYGGLDLGVRGAA